MRSPTGLDTILDIWSTKRLVLLRLAVILGVLSATASASLFMSRSRVDPIMFLAGAIAILGLTIWNQQGQFELGILAIALTAGLLNFFTIPTGTQSRIVVSLVVATGLMVLWFIQMLVVDKQVHIEPSPINKPLLSFVVISIAAYVWSNLLRDPLVFVPNSWLVTQLAALTVNILLPLLVLLVCNKIKETRWLEWLTWILIGLGVFKIITVLFHLPTSILIDNGSRGLFITWVGALAYALALFDQGLAPWKRGLLLILLVGLIYYYFVRNIIWVSGWLPLIATCVVITFMRSKKLFIATSLIVAVYVALNLGWFYQKIYVDNVNEGDTQRWALWQTNLDLIAKHPVFGVGPAGYAVYYMTYHPNNARSTHNNYFDVVAQTGIIGFAAFVWLFITFLLTGYRLRQELSGRRDFEEAFATATLAGCVAALVAMMLGDWVLPFAYNQTITGFDNAAYTWIFLGGMVSLYLIQKTRSAPPRATNA